MSTNSCAVTEQSFIMMVSRVCHFDNIWWCEGNCVHITFLFHCGIGLNPFCFSRCYDICTIDWNSFVPFISKGYFCWSDRLIYRNAYYMINISTYRCTCIWWSTNLDMERLILVYFWKKIFYSEQRTRSDLVRYKGNTSFQSLIVSSYNE